MPPVSQVYPTLKVGNRFHNDIGLDINVKGVLEILKLTLEAFGKDFGLGPLLRNEHNIGSFDLGSIFDRTFDLNSPLVGLPEFRLGTTDDDMNGIGGGENPGNAITLVPGMPVDQPDRFARAIYYGVPLSDMNGTSASSVELLTPGGANFELIALQEGQTLEVLNADGSVGRVFDLEVGKPRGFRADRWRITGFDRPIDGRGLFAMVYSGAAPGLITARPIGADLGGTETEATTTINRAAANRANAIFIESDNIFDIDGDGQILVSTDGAILTRYMDGMVGDALIANVVAANATRSDADDIMAYSGLTHRRPDRR